MEMKIHPSAVIDKPTHIGFGTRIWHFAHVMANAEIGEDCSLGQNVFVASGVRIGRGCKIQNNVSIYEGVVLEEYVFCGPSVVFTNVKHPRSEISRSGEYEQTIVERGATLGANCTVVCGTRVGCHAFIAAGAVVTRDVPAFALMMGAPARRIGWVGPDGFRLNPVKDQLNQFCCPATGQLFVQRDKMTLVAMDSKHEAKAESPIPLINLKAQHETIRRAARAAIDRLVESQQFVLGAEVEAFEREIADDIGAPHAIGCASGSDAILLALMGLGLERGDEIITSPFTFFATAGSPFRMGVRPVFCDIDPVTFNIDTERIAARINERTRAIIPVHLFGRCAEMDAIDALARERGLKVIEDAAQAIGATYGGRQAGTLGDVGCFSFFPTKNLGGYGDGGLMTTADGELAERLRALRVHGQTGVYQHEWVGFNSRLDAIQAAVVRVKLGHLDSWNQARAANAARYRELFEQAGILQGEGHRPEMGRVITPAECSGRHTFHQYVIRAHADQRDGLIEALRGRGIGCAVYYPLALHLQPCFAELGYRPGDMPEAERASREALALPIYPELTHEQLERIVEAISGHINR